MKISIILVLRCAAFLPEEFGVIVTSTETQRKEWLDEVREITRDMFTA